MGIDLQDSLSPKAQELISYLARHEGGPEAAEENILAALWPETDARGSRPLFLQAVHEIVTTFKAAIEEPAAERRRLAG
jgi:two-component SAPR family response regulator